MHDKIFDNFPKNRATRDTNTHLAYIKSNVRRYMDEHDLSANEFAKRAGVSPNTIHSILYKGIDDCKLSTAIAIAATIGIGVDELANTGAMPDMSLESVQISRTLPQYRIEQIRRFIRWQKFVDEREKQHLGKFIDVMNMDYNRGHLIETLDFERVEISEFPDDIKAITFKGMRMPCDDYIEFYRAGDVILLSNDRMPRRRERCLVRYYERIFIVHRDYDNGVWGYRGIRDSLIFVPEEEIEYLFGRVVGVKHT